MRRLLPKCALLRSPGALVIAQIGQTQAHRAAAAQCLAALASQGHASPSAVALVAQDTGSLASSAPEQRRPSTDACATPATAAAPAPPAASPWASRRYWPGQASPLRVHLSPAACTAWLSPRHLTTGTAALSGAPIVAYPLAQTGEGISECELIQWFVKEGDVVKEFDKICEVQSDKASVEISSRFDAKVLKLHHNKGDIVKVGATLVHLQVAEGTSLPPDMLTHVVQTLDSLPATPPAAASHPPPPPPPPPPPSAPAAPSVATPSAAPPPAAAEQPSGGAEVEGSGGHVLTSPAVRRLAREAGVDLKMVSGTGPKGRITKEDVDRYIAAQQQVPAAAPAAAAPAGGSSKPSTPAHAHSAPHAAGVVLADTELPVRGYRRAMVKSMQAVANVPHFHLHDEAVVDSLMAVRKHLAHDHALGGGKLTMLPFIIKAVSLTLAEHPILNASLSADHTSITLRGAHNIGVAMATPAGLVVPNIKQVQRLSVAQIAHEVARLQAAALSGKLTAEEVTGGTFTISNIGSIGGVFANPLVNPPEVAILAIGRVRQVASVPGHHHGAKDAPAATAAAPAPGFHLVLGMSWGADHRVVDGAGLTHASNSLKALLERPERMLLRTA